jgi:hypothetical protein
LVVWLVAVCQWDTDTALHDLFPVHLLGSWLDWCSFRTLDFPACLRDHLPRVLLQPFC